MAKDKNTEELSLEEAINAVKRLSKPDRPNEEFELLKNASSTLLNEVQPGFEFEEDEDGGSSATEELTKPPGFLEQLGNQAATLGPAGLIALGSAAYFQVDTVVEETRIVQQVAEEKWEEVKLEHPNINWDDPMAGFTTMLGMGDIDIDLDTPEPKTESKASNNLKDGSSNTSDDNDEVSDKPSESNEPAPEAEEQVEEKPKKKKGLFSFLTGGDDDDEEPDSEEQGETTKDGDTIPDEQAEEKSTEEPKTKTSEGEVDGGKQATQPEANANTAKSNGVKKSGGGFLSLFGINSNKKEVVEQGDISAGEEPVIDVTEVESETEAPPISNNLKVEAKPEINIADIVVNAEVIVDDILIDPEIQTTSIDNTIEQVITSDEGTIIVSPSGPLYATQY